jgi:CheY-like chemotaxis protein
MYNTPIIIIDDDEDDQVILGDIIRTINPDHKIIFYTSCSDFLEYLKITTDKPFIIFCDINLPRMNGLEMKRIMDDDKYLNEKSIPFIFYSTAVSKKQIKEAYRLRTQGFFQKDSSIDKMKETISFILSYWSCCHHPNSGWD